MTISMIIAVTVALLLLLLASRFPIALALGLSGACGLILLKGTGYTASVLGSVSFSQTYSFGLTIIPMFILMGLFAVRANVAEYVYTIAARAVRRAPGGLGVATVMACAGFAAVSGSSIGTAATMSKLSIAQMRRHGYPASLASALVAVAGTLGVMIPPSTFLVLYAIMTSTSVAQMLAGGVVPGLLSAAAYITYIMTLGARRIGRSTDPEDLADAVDGAQGEVAGRSWSSTVDGESPVPWRSLPWQGLVYIAILFSIVLGGMYSGVFTSTESAAIGALAAVVILVFENRRRGARGILTEVRRALQDTAATTSMVFFIIIGSAILSAFFIAARVPQSITEAVTAVDLPPTLTMALLLACLIPLGMALESLSILVITVPILYPIAMEYGFDSVWLGILIVKLIEIGMVTPPVGINAFVVAGSAGLRTDTVFKGLLPLFLVELVVVVILFLFPQLSLFLPSLVNPAAG
ncbi:TRAP transporter large permease [uncultured Serinicoccus sp.]|uniref:TRAP transporter large permease n=1 Tax=uncultured Serinicoccus sp. TaxID=735514 RepID=UPI00261FEC74|nr:TRAP transporter large permease [uncultured Serinicoccus sp.]